MKWRIHLLILALFIPVYMCPQKSGEIEPEASHEYNYDKAIAVNLGLIEDAEKINDTRLKADQLRSLGLLYIKKGEREKGIAMLKRSYHEAVTYHHMIEAKKSVEALQAIYKKGRNDILGMRLYDDFLRKLEDIILGDSTIMDWKLSQLNAEKIAQLEKEQALTDLLLQKKNNLNTVLVCSVCLAVILLLFIVRSLYVNKRQQKKIALQSLRREMNPHFIFNSLNSINQYIAQNDELAANKFLSSYSRLMRNMMETSNKDFVTLHNEIEQMTEYLELEQMRFHEKFEYAIEIDESLDIEDVLVPNMLIQPQLENAIWHGLRYKEEKGLLLLRVKRLDKKLIGIEIEDNGIGYFSSQRLKTKHQNSHKSRGFTNTVERVNLLNELYRAHIDIDIHDKKWPDTGVVVTITFPYRLKGKRHGKN